MPPDQANNYDALKKAVLKRYQLTEEGLRTKFRESKPERGETVFQFIARLNRYFNRWTEMAEINQTYDDLQDLMVREQFIQTCSTDLALFLKERKARSRDELTQLAEQYIEAHGSSITSNKTPKSNASMNKPQQRQSNVQAASYQKFPSNRTCYICNKEGHMARDCKDHARKKAIGAALAYEAKQSSGQDSTPKNLRDRNNNSYDA